VAGQGEVRIQYWHCMRAVAPEARCLAVGVVRFVLQSSRSFEGLRCIGEERFAECRGHCKAVVDRWVGLVVVVRGEVPSIQFQSEVVGRGFCGGAH
jgi:hypothetical protein